MALRFPRLRRGGETFFLGIAESFDEAHALALDQAYDHLVGERGIDPFEAYALISARCDMRLGGPASAIVMAVLPDDWGAATLNRRGPRVCEGLVEVAGAGFEPATFGL